jgi:hypothetical protein
MHVVPSAKISTRSELFQSTSIRVSKCWASQVTGAFTTRRAWCTATTRPRSLRRSPRSPRIPHCRSRRRSRRSHRSRLRAKIKKERRSQKAAARARVTWVVRPPLRARKARRCTPSPAASTCGSRSPTSRRGRRRWGGYYGRGDISVMRLFCGGIYPIQCVKLKGV